MSFAAEEVPPSETLSKRHWSSEKPVAKRIGPVVSAASAALTGMVKSRGILSEKLLGYRGSSLYPRMVAFTLLRGLKGSL